MHTHLEQWAADDAEPGEQLGVRCLDQGSRGQFLPEPRFEPTTSGYKSDALSTRATTARVLWHCDFQLNETIFPYIFHHWGYFFFKSKNLVLVSRLVG